jgi:hypothetical protein
LQQVVHLSHSDRIFYADKSMNLKGLQRLGGNPLSPRDLTGPVETRARVIPGLKVSFSNSLLSISADLKKTTVLFDIVGLYDFFEPLDFFFELAQSPYCIW